MKIEGAYEIIECLEQAYSDDPLYLLSLLKSLHSGSGVTGFKDRLEEICQDKELCTECFESLKIETIQDRVGEYGGTPAYETIYKRRCTKCGRIY